VEAVYKAIEDFALNQLQLKANAIAVTQ
jgi:hypothetical protein